MGIFRAKPTSPSLLTFNHLNTTSMKRGAYAGASGVCHPTLRTIGTMVSMSSANGSFTSHGGFPQIAQKGDDIWVPDSEGNRVQRFTRTTLTGAYVYADQCSSADAFGSGTVDPVIAAYDPVLDQLHFACWDQYVDNTWVGVWARSSWPSLTVANRVRSYGSNALADAADKLLTGMSVTIDGTYAACSSFGSTTNRLVVYNHTDNTVVAQLAQAAGDKSTKFTTDGAGRWWVGNVGATAVHEGLHEVDIDAAGLPSLGRYDTTSSQGASRWKRFRTSTPEVSDVQYYNGRVYVREIFSGLIKAWDTSGNFVDEFMFPGGASATEQFGSAPLVMDNSSAPHYGKMNIWLAPDGASDADCDDMLVWSSHADNGNDQSFISVIPISTAESTWSTVTTGVLKGFIVSGEFISPEKVKLEYKKNSGSWHTVPWTSLGSSSALAAIGDVNYAGDTLNIRLSTSVWDRLDSHSVLTACRDKMPPKNVTVCAVMDAFTI